MVNLRQGIACTNVLCAILAYNLSLAFAFSLPNPTTQTHHRLDKQSHLTSKNKQRSHRQPFAVVLNQQAREESIPVRESSDKSNNLLLSFKNVANQKRSKFLLGTAAAISLVFSQRLLLSQLLFNALEGYKGALVTKPLRTKVLTGASLAVIGDYLAQLKEGLSSKGGQYNIPRAASFAAFDSCYRMFQHVAIPQIVKYGQGNLFYAMFKMLPMVSLPFCTAMERTFLYQFVLIPFFYYPVFFTFTGFMQGLSLEDTVNRAKTTFLPCWKRNLLFWIPTQMVMFGLISENWQIPFVCVMGILWSMILSVVAGKVTK